MILRSLSVAEILAGKIVQCTRQVGITIRDTKVFADGFKFFQNRLTQAALKILVGPAIKNSAGGETVFINRAFTLDVIGTSPGRHWFYFFAVQIFSQINQLRRRYKQTMVELCKIATFPAGPASTRQTLVMTGLRIQPIINFGYCFEQPIVCLLVLRPPFFALSYLFNLLKAVERAVIYTTAFLSCLVPVIGAFQIAFPERPGPALVWPDRVNHTSFPAVNFPQEYAVLIATLFDNRRPQSHTPQEFLPNLSGRCLQEISDELYLRPGNPDVALIWSRTAPAALPTLEV